MSEALLDVPYHVIIFPEEVGHISKQEKLCTAFWNPSKGSNPHEPSTCTSANHTPHQSRD